MATELLDIVLFPGSRKKKKLYFSLSCVGHFFIFLEKTIYREQESV